MSEKKKPTQEELVEAMDAQVAAARDGETSVVAGDPNDGGFVQVLGHGWTDEEAELRNRIHSGEDVEVNPVTPIETGTASAGGTSAPKKTKSKSK